tara:strand:- start:193 stop:1365 length:1173 start_codon:yes stop_codon:yes gene_type:complete
MAALNEAYITGLLIDYEQRTTDLGRKLKNSQEQASQIDDQLGQLLTELENSRAALVKLEKSLDERNRFVADSNMEIASLHQEIAQYKKKQEDLKIEMERLGQGAIHRRLRRERAKLTVQIEDREEEIGRLRAEVEDARQEVQEGEQTIKDTKDETRATTLKLDGLQNQLPSPYLFSELFMARCGQAHANLYLEKENEDWEAAVLDSIGLVIELHKDLRAGKYRLDKNSDIVGGRALATGEAMYAAMILKKPDLALEIFSLATDPSLYFHQIFNVFRVWILGLYLNEDYTELKKLLRTHRYAGGLREAYVLCFLGLLLKDKDLMNKGVRDITKHEWELWQAQTKDRGGGIVNMGATALTLMALDRGIAVKLPGPTVPDIIIAPKKKAPRKA